MSAIKVQLCKYGHDTFLNGRNKYGACNLCRLRIQKVYEHKNPLRKRDFQWKARGIKCTEELYNELLTNQQKCCAVCKKHESNFKIKLAVDHCHENGNIRGLLCRRCNTFVIPLVEKHRDYVDRAIAYLKDS